MRDASKVAPPKEKKKCDNVLCGKCSTFGDDTCLLKEDEGFVCDNCGEQFSHTSRMCYPCYQSCSHCMLSADRERKAEDEATELRNEVRVLKKLLKEALRG